jgi:hypothetical protein
MKTMLRLALLPLLCVACGDGEEARETELPTSPLRSAACDAGTPPTFSGVLVLPGAPSPLPGVKARVQYIEEWASVDGVDEVLVALQGSGLRESPLPFTLCGSYPDRETIRNPTLEAFVDMNGNDSRDAGDYVGSMSLRSETLDLTGLTLTLTRI